MTARLLRAATSNAFSTTLNGSIDNAVTTITLTSVTGLQASGVLVIDRQDGSGNNTPTKREFVTYTGISGNDLTGVTRGVAGSTAQAHTSGALVEETMSVTHWNDLYDFLTTEHTGTGTHVLSTPTITSARMITSIQASGASVILGQTTLNGLLQASGASIVGSFPLYPTWVIPGFASAATTGAGKPLAMPRAGNWESFTLLTRTPVSTASLTITVNKNGVAIFDTIGRPNILGGGTFVSTASVATKVFAAGDIFTVDISTGGNVSDLTLIGKGVL